MIINVPTGHIGFHSEAPICVVIVTQTVVKCIPISITLISEPLIQVYARGPPNLSTQSYKERIVRGLSLVA